MAPELYNSFPKPRICLIDKDVMVRWQQITRENQVQHTASCTRLTLWVPSLSHFPFSGLQLAALTNRSHNNTFPVAPLQRLNEIIRQANC